MNVLRAEPLNLDEKVIHKVVCCLNQGGIILYPTDTVYGLGCRIDNHDAVKRVYEIKNRDAGNPLSIACSGIKMLEEYVHLKRKEKLFIRDNAGGGYTFILGKKTAVDDLVTGGHDTVGVRLIPLPLVTAVIEGVGCPIVSTSANTSGGSSPSAIGDVEKEILDSVDLVVDGGECRIGRPSRVVDLGSKKLLRD
ncbi:MAG: L-threonylcarbamoyladenylate synthase [Candidatus Altiarchaeota archaeon]|nr:L-threonylcarbamoyladenylate synthase [Candidatus Altiarchaeota archaeon]